MTFEKQGRDTEGRGLVATGTNPKTGGLELSVLPLKTHTPLGREERLRVDLIAKGQGFNQSCPCGDVVQW